MKIKQIEIGKIKPYENNTLIHSSDQITQVAESIKIFGFKVPIIVDKEFVIISGHCRYEAALSLNLIKVPCIVAEDLSEDKVKAFRIADNRVREKAIWDFEKVELELKSIKEVFDLSFLDFEFNPVEISEVKENDAEDEGRSTEAGPSNQEETYSLTVSLKTKEEAEELCERLSKEGYECTIDI